MSSNQRAKSYRLTARTAVAALAALGLLAAGFDLAGCSGPREVPGAWHLIDLWESPPAAGGHPQLRGEYSTIRDRVLRTLLQNAGSDLVWRLDLGDDPRLSFRPLPTDHGCVYAVSVRGPEVEQELYRELAEPAGDNPARTVDVPLDPFARESIELVLRIDDAGEGACEKGHWGSPAVLHRVQVPRFHRGGLELAAMPPAEKPNILLIGADTLRADALGVYGREPSVTPAIDALAAESDVWLNAFSSTNNTNPSFISLMTGYYAKNHGVYDLKTPLPEDHTTLAEILAAAGYDTGAILSVRHLANHAGLRQGFERYFAFHRQLFAETAVHQALGWMQQFQEPWFLWLHLFDPHVPHNPPQPYDRGLFPESPPGAGPVTGWKPFRQPGPRDHDPRTNLPGHVDLYPGEVAYLDRQIGLLLDFMRSRGLLERTVVAFVADHGETLGERGQLFTHMGLHDNTTHVPLIVRWPGRAGGRRIAGLVQHFDLFPTLLAAAGVEPPRRDAVDLYELSEGDRGRRAVFTEGANHLGRMIRTADFKYFFEEKMDGSSRHRLYDLRQDPQELVDLGGEDHPEQARLEKILSQWLSVRREGDSEPESLQLSEEEKAQLEALGYIQ